MDGNKDSPLGDQIIGNLRLRGDTNGRVRNLRYVESLVCSSSLIGLVAKPIDAFH